MRIKALCFVPVMILSLSACRTVPENLKENDSISSSREETTQIQKVACNNIYDDLNAALETGYEKISLPEKSRIPLIRPEGIYELELGYINSESSVDWLKNRVEMLYDALGFEFGGQTVTDELSAYRKDEHNDVSMLRYSQPYCRWEAALNGVSMLSDDITDTDTLFYDRSSADDLSETDVRIANKALLLADKIDSVTGGELDNVISDIYTLHTEAGVGYEVEIRKSYKGIGIQNLFSSYNTDTETEKGNDLLAVSMQTYLDLDSELDPEYFIGCNSYSVRSANKLDKVISFRSACDILERELAENVRFRFDTVLLMYEPRGESLSSEMTDPGAVKCIPKWFFISDSSSQSGEHSINYVTVDCRDGTVEVVMP